MVIAFETRCLSAVRPWSRTHNCLSDRCALGSQQRTDRSSGPSPNSQWAPKQASEFTTRISSPQCGWPHSRLQACLPDASLIGDNAVDGPPAGSLTGAVALEIAAGFDLYQAAFTEITRRAKDRFERCD